MSRQQGLSDDEIRAVLARCSYRDWSFGAGRMHLTGRPVVDANCPTVDSRTGTPSRGGCSVEIRGDDEAAIVRAAYEATVAFSTHEIGEFFTFDGTRPFDPHARIESGG